MATSLGGKVRLIMTVSLLKTEQLVLDNSQTKRCSPIAKLWIAGLGILVFSIVAVPNDRQVPCIVLGLGMAFKKAVVSKQRV